jgi:hypothetical protein
MSEVLKLLEKQARWQKSRKDLSWAEKVRMAERVRADAIRWLLSARKPSLPTRRSASDRT